MRLEHEAGQADLLEAAREADVVDAALDHVGRDVHVDVDTAAHQLSRARGGDCASPALTWRPLPASERSQASLAAATRGSTSSSSSIATAAAISSTRRPACLRLPSTSRRSRRPSAAVSVLSMFP